MVHYEESKYAYDLQLIDFDILNDIYSLNEAF